MSVHSIKLRIKTPLDTRRWQRFLLLMFSWLGGRVKRMSHRRAMALAAKFGVFVYRVARRPRRIAQRNLRLAQFPSSNSTAVERDALIRQVFVSFSKSLVDFLRAPGLSLAELDQLVTAEGLHHLTAALEHGKGVLLFTGHFGNWEILGRFLAQHNVPLTVVARDVADPALSAYVSELRASGGLGVKTKGGSVRELLTLLKRNEAIGLLPDQNSGDLFVPFFGVPAGTVAGPATLSLHTGAALLPAFCTRCDDDTYRVLILPPLDTRPSDDKDADIRRIMTEVNCILESVIRKHPDQWLWIHNRWKSAFEDKNAERSWPNDAGGEARERARARWQDK